MDFQILTNRIQYTLNDTLYSPTTTSVSSMTNISLSGVSSVTLNATVTRNFIKNVFVTKDVSF